VGLERVLAEHRALGLVVELQVDPVDGVVPLAVLRPADELAPVIFILPLYWFLPQDHIETVKQSL